ncbi:hypothetical protein ACTFIZ_002727 [Dictyostelium cf. discoideum]
MLFNQYVFKYKQRFYGHREYDTIFPIALIDSLSSQEFIFIVNNLNYKMPYYLSILNSIALFLIFPINIFLFVFHHNSWIQTFFLLFLIVFSIFLLAINIFELYLPKKRIITFIEELNNEYSNRLISFHINKEEEIVLLYPYPDHFYKNIPFPFYQIHQPQPQQHQQQQHQQIQKDQNQQLHEPLPGKQYQEQQNHEPYTLIDFQPIIQTNQYSEPLLSEIEEYTPIDFKSTNFKNEIYKIGFEPIP